MSKPAAPLLEFTNHFYPARIFFAPSKAHWKAIMREISAKEPWPHKDHFGGRVTTFHSGGGLAMVVSMTQGATDEVKPNVWCALLVHEIIHVKQYIENLIFSSNTDQTSRLDAETEAYLIQQMAVWIFGQVDKTNAAA